MDSSTPVTMSLGKIVSGAIAFAGVLILGAWGVFSLTLGGVYDDLSDIKGRLSSAQTDVGEVQSKAMDADTEIRQSLSNIDKNVAVMASDFSSFKASIEKGLDGVQMAVNGVNDSVGKLVDQYSDMSVRLVRIEAAVTSDKVPQAKEDGQGGNIQQLPQKLPEMPQPQN